MKIKKFATKKIVSHKTFKVVQNVFLEQGNNTETSKINCINGFEVLIVKDDDDNNDSYSKSRKSDKAATSKLLISD